MVLLHVGGRVLTCGYWFQECKGEVSLQDLL